MIIYGHLLYLLTILLILIMARTAIRWYRTADLLRSLCVEYLTQSWIRQGLRPNPNEAENEIDRRLEEMEETL